MSLCENGKPEKFLLLVSNFNMTLTVSGTLEAGARIQYLFTQVRGEALRHFESFSADVESMQTLNVDDIIRSLAQ